MNRPKNVEITGFASITVRVTNVGDLLDAAEYLKRLGIDEHAEADTHAGKIWIDVHPDSVPVEEIECCDHMKGENFDLLIPVHACHHHQIPGQMSIDEPTHQASDFDWPTKDRIKRTGGSA